MRRTIRLHDTPAHDGRVAGAIQQRFADQPLFKRPSGQSRLDPDQLIRRHRFVGSGPNLNFINHDGDLLSAEQFWQKWWRSHDTNDAARIVSVDSEQHFRRQIIGAERPMTMV